MYCVEYYLNETESFSLIANFSDLVRDFKRFGEVTKIYLPETNISLEELQGYSGSDTFVIYICRNGKKSIKPMLNVDMLRHYLDQVESKGFIEGDLDYLLIFNARSETMSSEDIKFLVEC